MSWSEAVGALSRALLAVEFTDARGEPLTAADGFQQWTRRTVQLRRDRRTLYMIGNGASASMASHFSADLAKNAHVHTQVFTDLSLITAISNDIGYEDVYAEPLRRRAEPGDMLVAISSSGRSPNILKAATLGRGIGMFIVTLSAMNANNPLRATGALNAYVASPTYGQAETAHAAILHHWMDSVAEGPM